MEGLVVNRVHPSFGQAVDLPAAPVGSALAVLSENLRSHQAVNTREESTLAAIVTEVAPSPVARVPLLDIDVHDLDGLAVVADQVFGTGGGPVVAPDTAG